MDHTIPTWPRWVGRLRWAELAFSIIYLAFMAGSLVLLNSIYGTYFSYYSSGSAYTQGQAFGIFTGGWTFLIMLGVLVTTRSAKDFYLMWYHLAVESITVLFWLVAMALTARDAAVLQPGSFYSGYGFNSGTDAIVYGLLAVGAVIAGAELIMFALTLVYLSIGCHNHRMAEAAGPPPIMQQQVPPVQQPQPQYTFYDGKAEPTVNVVPPPGHPNFQHQAPVNMPAGLA